MHYVFSGIWLSERIYWLLVLRYVVSKTVPAAHLACVGWQCCVQQNFRSEPKMETIPPDTKCPSYYGLFLDASFASKVIQRSSTAK